MSRQIIRGYTLQELPGDRPEFVGLATQQECLERLGLSQDVSNIQGARAAST